MARLQTEITEIITGLALLGYRQIDHALGVRPRMMTGVTEAHFDRLWAAFESGEHAQQFATAWSNGQQFAFAEDGLRGRSPWWVEWKGPDRPPAYEQIPADLRVDHVYLISCKYGSSILMNASPAHLFDRLLASRSGSKASDWYEAVSPDAYGELWSTLRADLATHLPVTVSLPDSPTDLDGDGRGQLKAGLKAAGATARRWTSEQAADAYRWLAADVSDQSAKRWLSNLAADKRTQEEMLWRLLRFAAAPYFVLGSAVDGTPLHYRVATPWDFRQRYKLVAFDAWGDAVGQPLVRWQAQVRDRVSDTLMPVEGHVEVRWSHGKFGGMPEAKIYLDSPHHDVPGYFPLHLPKNHNLG